MNIHENQEQDQAREMVCAYFQDLADLLQRKTKPTPETRSSKKAGILVASSSSSTRSPPTVSAHTHLIGPHAYNFSTNQSDAYTFSTSQSQVYKNSTGQSQACRFSTVGFCWWPVVVTAPIQIQPAPKQQDACGQGILLSRQVKQNKRKSLYWDFVTDDGFHRNIDLLLISNADVGLAWLGLGWVHACEINNK